MTQRQLCFVACRVMAVWMFCQWINILIVNGMALVSPFLSRQTGGPSFLSYLPAIAVQVITMGVVSIELWRKSETLSWYMVGRDAMENDEGEAGELAPEGASAAGSGLSAEDLMPMAFSAVGLLTFMLAIQPLMQSIGILISTRDNSLNNQYYTALQPAWQISGRLIQMALAVWLLFNGVSLARLVRRMKEM